MEEGREGVGPARALYPTAGQMGYDIMLTTLVFFLMDQDRNRKDQECQCNKNKHGLENLNFRIYMCIIHTYIYRLGL